MWTCPLCREGLLAAEQEKSLVCSAGHCYDVAKEGYVNLILANRKRSVQPGDSKEMISARGRVHEAGLYQPLASAIQEQLAALESPPSQVLDLGCGEGYYSAAIQQALPGATIFGIDVAKPAVKSAAKNCPQGNFAVASVIDVPLVDSSIDLVTSVFAPVDAPQVSRLLKPEGIYLKITPASRHLWELRCLLYNLPRPHQRESQLLPGFESVVETDLHYTRALSGELLRDLVAMTPYAYAGERENHEKLEALEGLTLQMSFDISVQRYKYDVEEKPAEEPVKSPWGKRS